jgi:hypothetical protein
MPPFYCFSYDVTGLDVYLDFDLKSESHFVSHYHISLLDNFVGLFAVLSINSY